MSPRFQPITDAPPVPLNVGSTWPMTETDIRDRAPKLAALLAPLVPPGEVVELRALHVPRGNWSPTVSGYFDDPVKFCEEALRLSNAGPAVYFTLNAINRDLLARRVNRVKDLRKNEPATVDGDVIGRRWLFLDFDPRRPAGISATDAEKAAAYALALLVRDDLAARGWPEPVIADSGNGYYLLFRIDQPAADGGLVERCIKALAARFDTPAAGLDTAVHNPARIIRVLGTANRKGDHTDDRPHRTSGIIHVPDAVEVVPIGLLEELAAEAPTAVKGGHKAASSGDPADHPLDDFNARAPWDETGLFRAGWQVRIDFGGGKMHLTRPDKATGEGLSATVGFAHPDKDGNPTFWAFSDATTFTPLKAYSKAQVYAHLNHSGIDSAAMSAATKALRAMGYGKQEPTVTFTVGAERPGAAGQDQPGSAKPGQPADWPDPIPLTPSFDPPPFPTDTLSPWMRDFARAVAEEKQVPPDLPAVLILGAAAAGLARKFVLSPRPGWEWEPLNLFVLCFLPPGERKSQTFSAVFDPVKNLERDLRAQEEPRVKEAESEYRVREKRVQHLEARIAKEEDAGERTRLRDDLRAARAELTTAAVPAMPLLRVDDDTPEMLAKELVQQGGRLLAASPEARTLENITRYADEPNMDVFLKGHAGDDIRSGRIGRGRDAVDRPALTCAYSPQPCVLETLGATPAMRGRGFLARWFFSLPTSAVGFRKVRAEPVPVAVKARYETALLNLWLTDYRDADQGTPHELTLTAEAQAELEAFEAWREPQLRPGGELATCAGWANKLNGLCARIAGNLHAGDGILSGMAWAVTPVSADVVRRAVRICREYAIPHALAAFGMMGESDAVVKARRVLRWLGDRTPDPAADFTKRDAFNGCRSAFETVDDLQPVLDLLERHYLIRPKVDSSPRSGAGRKPSPVYEVNPAADLTGSQNTQNTQNSGSGPAAGNSAYSAYSANGHDSENAADEPLYVATRPDPNRYRTTATPTPSPPAWQSELLALLTEFGPEWTSTAALYDRLNDRLAGPRPDDKELRKFLTSRFNAGEVDRDGASYQTHTWRIVQAAPATSVCSAPVEWLQSRLAAGPCAHAKLLAEAEAAGLSIAGAWIRLGVKLYDADGVPTCRLPDASFDIGRGLPD